MKYLYIWLAIINIIAFALAGFDKYKAKHHKWRIRENTLIASAALGGSVGLLAGMGVFHHKTRRKKFTVGVPVILVAQLAVALCFILLG